MNYNLVCNLHHWDDPELAEQMAAIFPAGEDVHSRKHWEIAQTVRAFIHLCHLPTTRFLGVGAGKEHTSFYLTRWGEVHATDLYVEGGWSSTAPLAMLAAPDSCAPFPYDRQRLIVQHMDGRDLRYPDNHFDGVFSCSSIEHFGTLDDIAQAAREIGRVLKPGGIAALATEFLIGGVSKGGWPGVIVFDKRTIQEAVVKPSGLTMVDPLVSDVTIDTLKTRIDLERCIALIRAGKPLPTPHVVVEHDGHIFTSVMLVLRKEVKA